MSTPPRGSTTCGRRHNDRHELTSLIEAGAELATSEPISLELLAGADTPHCADALDKLTTGLSIAGIDPRLDFRQAAAVHLAVRRNGQTIRSLVDCLIAAIAMRHDIALLHKDADYTAIAESLPLREHPVP